MFANNNEVTAAQGIDMQAFPEELLMEVMQQLPLRELKQVSGVSRQLRRVARDRKLWEGIFQVDEAVPQTSEETPTGRLWCASAVVEDSLYLYGGHTVEADTNLIEFVKNDLFQYNLVTKQWTKLEHEMGKKTELKCVVWDNSLWFVGGYNGETYTNEIRKYDIATKASTLVPVTGNPFSPRSALTAVVWKDYLVTFGGWSGTETQWYNDTSRFNFRTKEWQLIQPTTPPPSARTSHVAVVHGNSMFVFGGYSGDRYLNDLWELNLETNTWTELTTCGSRPEPRSRCCAAVYGNTMYVLGGWNKSAYYSDLHAYDFETRRWTKISNPNYEIPALSQYSMGVAHDLRHERSYLVMYGGYDGRAKACSETVHRYLLPTEAVSIEENCTHGRIQECCLRCSSAAQVEASTSNKKKMPVRSPSFRLADDMETTRA